MVRREAGTQGWREGQREAGMEGWTEGGKVRRESGYLPRLSINIKPYGAASALKVDRVLVLIL